MGRVTLDGEFQYIEEAEHQGELVYTGKVISLYQLVAKQEHQADCRTKAAEALGRIIERMLAEEVESAPQSPEPHAKVIGEPRIVVAEDHALTSLPGDPLERAHIETTCLIDARFDVAHAADADPVAVAYAVRRVIAEKIADKAFASMEEVMRDLTEFLNENGVPLHRLQ